MPTLGLPPGLAAAILVGALLIVPASALAWLFRAARLPARGEAAAAVIAGIICGVLAGPGVLGLAAPRFYQSAFVGGVAEREALRRLVIEQSQEMAALRSTDVTPSALTELRDQHEAQARPAREALEKARAARADVVDALGTGLASLAFLLSIGLRRLRRRGRAAPPSARRQMIAGVLSALTVTVGAGAAALLLMGAAPKEAAWFGLATACGWAAPGLRARLVGPEGRSLRLDALCTPAAGLPVALLFKAAAWGPMFALLLAISASRPPWGRFGRRTRRALRAAVYGLLAPGACAAAASRIDTHAVVPTGLFAIALVVSLIASTDLRWGATALGLRLVRPSAGGAPPWSAPMREAGAFMVSGVGLGMVGAALLVSIHGGVRPELIAGVLAAAVMLELTGGLYRFVTGGRREDEAGGPISG